MKKNLRIVSAAAAALLAVAPVAASAVSTVSADAVQTATQLGTVPALNNGDSVNVKPNIVLNTSHATSVKSALSVSFTATYNGTTATSNFKPSVSDVKLYKGSHEVTDLNEVKQEDAGTTYRVVMSQVGLNFGTKNANKEITLTMPKGDFLQWTPSSDTVSNSIKVKLDQNGTVTLHQVAINTTAKDFADLAGVYFVNKDLGNVVTSGNVTLNANANGLANVDAVVAQAEKQYSAYQVNHDNGKLEGTVSLSNDLNDALKKANISVDNAGFFKAPHTLTFNLTAKSNVNDASATLPVTVTFANVEAPKPVTVPSTGNVTIMHAAYTYELKDGKLTRVTSADTLHAYSEVPVYGTTTVNGKKYYRVSGEHEWYINAGNVDGTSRSLKHNSYVYNNKGKRVKSEGTWKKGSKHTTYGAAMNIKGNRMYRVNKNRYVKVVNFD